VLVPVPVPVPVLVLVLVLVLVGALLAPGCSGSDGPPAACTVTCPPGSRCEGNRCIPVCDPPCGPNQHCGADRTCHAGTAPDGGVVVPPVDAGGARDAGGGPGKDAGAKPDTVSPNKAMCDCLAKQPKIAYCLKQPVTCTKPADCCAQNPVPCGVAGNKFACVAGKCQRAGCKTKQECVTYAQALNLSEAASYVCHKALCPGGLDYCAPAIKACQVDKDCCKNLGSKAPCGVYQNHYTCDKGTCRYLGCTGNPECVSYAQLNALPGPGTWICRKTPCMSTGYCTTPPKTCTKPSDCCTTGGVVPCGVYSNRWRCEKGECVLDRCKDKQDCVSYASAFKDPDASAYNCIEL
jgi:hypothetical protein